MAGVRDGLTNLDRPGVRKALGATETRGVADDDGCGEEAGAFDAEEGAIATVPAPACGWMPVGCGVRSAPIRAKTATAEAATRTPLRQAEASEREIRCRPGRLPPPGRGGSSGTSAAAAPVSARRLPAPSGESPAGRSWAKPAMIDSASQPGAGWIAPTWASSSQAVGRSFGCLARQFPISPRSSPGTLPRLAGLLTSRYISAACEPEPNGPCPVAAKVSTAPRLNMSLAGVRLASRTCSGDMNPGEPIIRLVPVATLASAAWEIPKSMTRGPSSASSTLDGFRSPCTTPAAWMALRLSASPAASASTVRTGSGPWPRTASVSEGPATYAVASQGIGLSRSASTTSAVNKPLTFWAAATSRRNRARNSGSVASSVRMTLTAMGRPPADMARNTCPMPPLPS